MVKFNVASNARSIRVISDIRGDIRGEIRG